jgi:hypothetical protein
MRTRTVIAVFLVAVMASACTSTPASDVPARPSDRLSASQSPPSADLTLHIDEPPSQGVDGGQEVIMLVQQKVCADRWAGWNFSLDTTARSETSWTAHVKCTDGSGHTLRRAVLISWDSESAG